ALQSRPTRALEVFLRIIPNEDGFVRCYAEALESSQVGLDRRLPKSPSEFVAEDDRGQQSRQAQRRDLRALHVEMSVGHKPGQQTSPTAPVDRFGGVMMQREKRPVLSVFVHHVRRITGRESCRI